MSLFIKRMAVIFLVGLLVQTAYPQWTTDFENAKVHASKENKLILLNFSGSDWCAPCIRMRRDFFPQPEFIDFASQNLMLLNADFPRKKENMLSKEQQAANEILAEEYNNKGAFPATFLLDAEGKVLTSWIGYPQISLSEFIIQIRALIPKTDISAGMQVYKRELKLMGCGFCITVVADNEQKANEDIDLAINEIRRIDHLISSWDENSETSLINRYAGIKAVKVSKEVYELIERSKKVSELTRELLISLLGQGPQDSGTLT